MKIILQFILGCLHFGPDFYFVLFGPPLKRVLRCTPTPRAGSPLRYDRLGLSGLWFWLLNSQFLHAAAQRIDMHPQI